MSICHFQNKKLKNLKKKKGKKEMRKMGDHVEELVDESSGHQEMQDCSLLSFHQSREMGFDMLSWLPLDP